MEREIVKEYLAGASSTELAKKYGFKTSKSITDKVKKFNEKVRDQREAKAINKSYAHFSMKKIDSEFKAYYLGLLLTDGYIVGNTIGLDLTDEDCIQFISSIIGKEYKSYEREAPRQTRHRIVFNNPELIKELSRYGVVPRKTHILSGFTLEPDEEKFYPYLIRGLIDGDGWIRKDGKEFFICTASYEFAIWVSHILEDKLYMRNINISKGRTVWNVRTALYRNINILKDIVYDIPFGMSRKYNLLHSEPSETIMDDLYDNNNNRSNFIA